MPVLLDAKLTIRHFMNELSWSSEMSQYTARSARLACISLAMLSGASLSHAQNAPAPAAAPVPAAKVDEKNIPDWVKRQAENPFKFIIQQERTKPVRPAAVRDDRDAAARASSASTQTATNAVAPRRTAAPASAQAASQPAVATNAAPSSLNSASDSNNTANPVATVEAASASDTAATSAAAAPAAAAGAALPTAAAPANQPDPNELIPIEQAEPQITRDILQQGVRSGVVTVRFTVGTDGKVSEANVVRSTDRVFNRSTLNAVRQWKFAPVAEPQSATVEIAFKLDS
jgi:TonB family protein